MPIKIIAGFCWFNRPRLNLNSWYVDIPEHYFKPDNQLEISGSICKIEPAVRIFDLCFGSGYKP
ncbi:MAG TPA: hypothetical protein ACFYD0_14760, partial [Candidatus Wunengus sp. YC65]|uniref:hypothetical protein n=1 Tax=Candidatus Wunengus sp. YC65 TaxID=3367701 RepID=UPI004025793F